MCFKDILFVIDEKICLKYFFNIKHGDGNLFFFIFIIKSNDLRWYKHIFVVFFVVKEKTFIITGVNFIDEFTFNSTLDSFPLDIAFVNETTLSFSWTFFTAGPHTVAITMVDNTYEFTITVQAHHSITAVSPHFLSRTAGQPYLVWIEGELLLDSIQCGFNNVTGTIIDIVTASLVVCDLDVDGFTFDQAPDDWLSIWIDSSDGTSVSSYHSIQLVSLLAFFLCVVCVLWFWELF